jgi:hypothetical protein
MSATKSPGRPLDRRDFLARSAFGVGAAAAAAGIAGEAVAQAPAGGAREARAADDARTVQAHGVLTVAESKRLLARAVAQMPVVKKALRDVMVIVIKGTTNTYVAEELTGKTFAKGTYVRGKVYPAKGGRKLPEVPAVPDIVIEKGRVIENMPLADAVNKLKPGDVVIKGANALDYKNKTAGVMIGDPKGGTTGMLLPFVIARKAHLIIPVGLDKLVADDVVTTSLHMREPVETAEPLPSMFLITGEIVTEIEALKILAGVDAFQACAGGIGGAEGGVWMVWRGTPDEVEKASAIVQSIHGEPPYVG